MDCADRFLCQTTGRLIVYSLFSIPSGVFGGAGRFDFLTLFQTLAQHFSSKVHLFQVEKKSSAVSIMMECPKTWCGIDLVNTIKEKMTSNSTAYQTRRNLQASGRVQICN